jgi:O-antigen/teichoic acid export membrane protein
MSMSSSTAEPRGSLVARNALFNVLGQILPLLVGIVAIPVTLRGLGEARFGLLGLIWAILGYFGVLDLGLGRATTKFVAEYLGRGDATQLRRVATLSVASQTVLGVVGGIVLALLTPVAVSRVLGVPAGLQAEARGAFLVLAVSVPIVVLSLSLRAILEAAQRFDLVNLIRTPTSAAVFLVPAVAAHFGASLPAIVLLLLLVRVATCWATAAAVPRAIPGFRWEFRPSWEALRPLVGFGGWIAVSNVVSPLLGYLERFMLASVAGVAAVAYYAAPYEAVTRLLIVPAGLASALFPALSVTVADRRASLDRLLGRSVRYLLLVLAVPIMLLIGLSGPLVTAWLGPAFAARSAPAFAILAVGVLINALAHLPHVYLLGQGRPDLPAKFHLLELPLYVALAWVLIARFGVAGAALAWTVRVSLDAVLLTVAVWRVAGLSPHRLLGVRGGRAVGAVGALALVTLAVAMASALGVLARVGLMAGAAVAFGAFVWWFVLDDAERAGLRRVLP